MTDTVIFDLDGTLYDEERIYDQFARELARFVPESQRAQYLAEWESAKRRESIVRVGMGYEVKSDRLFRYVENRITTYVHWDGWEEPPLDTQPDPGQPLENVEAVPAGPPIEVPIFGPERRNIGDWWALADILAAHLGVQRDDRVAAFMATREFMDRPDFQFRPDPERDAVLESLRAAGKRLIAMSNSPSPSVEHTLDRVGIAHFFDRIIPEGQKPAGMTDLLASEPHPDRALSIGDNYLNDVEPALLAGSPAIYIDRHDTGLGKIHERCHLVSSQRAAWQWLRENAAR